VIETPLAWFLAIYMKLELTGVCIAIIVADILLTIIGVLLFRTGRWKLKKV
jgi:Na+-driven multidrug efflux pump